MRLHLRSALIFLLLLGVLTLKSAPMSSAQTGFVRHPAHTSPQSPASAHLLALWSTHKDDSPEQRTRIITPQAVQKLLSLGADLNAHDRDGDTPLLWAASDGETKIVRLLLDQGAEANVHDHSGYTPLIGAVSVNSVPVVKMLLAHGAKVNIPDQKGYTAVMAATSPQVAQLLLDAGADVNAKQTNGTTALMEACIDVRVTMVQWLVSHGADVNAKDWQGMTPLMDAAVPDTSDDSDAITASDTKGHSISFVASTEPKEAVPMVQFLLEHGAAINTKNDNGETALLWAAAWENIDVVQVLVAHGADVNAKAKDGDSALHEMIKAHSSKMVKLLKSAGAKA